MLFDRRGHWWHADAFDGPFYCPLCGYRGSTPDWNPRWGVGFFHDDGDELDGEHEEDSP